MAPKEGFVEWNGHKTWYEVFGDPAKSSKPTLVLLHGGPGYPHQHLENLSVLADKDYTVVLYDQLGCGKSDRPDDPSLWTVELFIEELNAVRKELKLDRIYLLGHSWGGSLAAAYALTKPKGVEKIILSSPLLDSHLWVEETDKLKDLLPEWAAKTMRKHEAAGTTDSVEYTDAYIEFKNRFVRRIQPQPKLLQECDKQVGAQVYNTMWGPSESCATGTLKDWSVLDRLHEITIPILLLSGRHDEATPHQMEVARAAFTVAPKWIVFENSSHSANFEEPEAYVNAVDGFLQA